MTSEILIASRPFGRRVIALWERVLRFSQRPPRRLRLCESLPLGERRFVAVVEFDQSRFLVGGTSSSLVLLSRLQNAGGRAEDMAGEGSLQAKTSIQKRQGEIC